MAKEIKTSTSGDPSNSKNVENTNAVFEKILKQLEDINQNTLDQIDETTKLKTAVNAANETKSSLTTTNTTQDNTSATKSINIVEEAQAKNIAAKTAKLEQDKKAAEELQAIKLQQAKFSLERSKLLAQQQDEDRAKRLEEEALQKNKQDEADASKYNPIANGFNAVRNAHPGTFSKMLTLGLTGGIGNILGLDKVLSAAGSFVGGKVSSAIGKPFQQRAQRKEREAADDRAIQEAIHQAELSKRIDDTLRARGLKANESQGQVVQQQNNTPVQLNNNSSLLPGQNNKSAITNEDDRTTASIDDDEDEWRSQINEKLTAIYETLVDMNGGKPGSSKKNGDDEEEEEESIFDKLLSGLGGIGTGILNVGKVALAAAGPAYMGYQAYQAIKDFKNGDTLGSIQHGVKAGVSGLGGAIGYAIGGKVGAELGSIAGALAAEAAEKAGEAAVNWLDKKTNMMGSKSVEAGNNMMKGMRDQKNKDASAYAGGMAQFDLMETQYEQNKDNLEKGMLWGKSSRRVAEWRGVRARVATESLILSGEEAFVNDINEQIKNKKITKEKGEELLIKHAKALSAKLKEENKNRSVEELKAENTARIEERNKKKTEAEAEAKKQQLNTNESNIEKIEVEKIKEAKEKDAEEIKESLDNVVSDDQAKILIKAENLNMTDQNGAAFGAALGGPTPLPSDNRLSENALNQKQAMKQSQHQTQQLQHSISTVNNGGNTVTQMNVNAGENKTAYPQMGEAAKTMLKN